MILHLAGTSDARELAVLIQQAGYAITASVVTDSAANSLQEAGIPVRVGRMTADEMSVYIKAHNIRAVVDAAHPFAEEAHKNAMTATQACGIPYLRFEREALTFADHPQLHFVDDYAQAAEKAAELGGHIMLTTGSKTLQIFTERLLGVEGTTLYARMLPRIDNMEKCAELGVEQKHIIAMQGPFTKELNIALYRNYGIDVVVTKESGKVGAVDDKVESALELGLHVIIIGRPGLSYGDVYSEFEPVLQHLHHLRGDLVHGI
ncbi:precorrin-6A reductase [Tumebacillus permanentifrigoris]|uniref:Cobalt-precorrin 6A reductase n=1 Tax=Tumebacillus permanentifrigoris TaxID=378543 RepID=A0A316DCC7_9BACL|nr:precorrin-6A reductase [Tumebacillus permanentifrigoris]PWK14833.1 cobalt-precorrin 6A reductase [Tumebacillus permanentifrigoris]